MRFQTRTGYCGAGMIVNLARALGKRVSESRVCALTGTDPDGTDEFEVMAGLRGLGFTATQFNATLATLAWSTLHGSLLQGKPVGISVDNDNHWVAITGLLGDRVIMVDSSRVVRNLSENGVHVIDRQGLLRRWRAKAGSLYGIIVGKASR